MQENIYTQGLEKCAANYLPLSPLSFLRRTALVYPDHLAVIDGKTKKTWREVANRCQLLSQALKRIGVVKNDTVAVLAPNTLACYECHFGVPMAGAVLNAINTRLDAATIRYILEHGQAKVFLVDSEFAAVAHEVVSSINESLVLIEISAEGYPLALDAMTYEQLLETGEDGEDSQLPEDEWDAISLNYTSGTTGRPKGVVYHHRGAYLNALSNIMGWQMPHHAVYLWTLPMFHCNGWCFPWSLAANAGTSICLRRVNAENIFNAIADYEVTHFCGAPIIMGMLINAPEQEKREFSHSVNMMTAAAPPPASVLQAMQDHGFKVTHAYGLTETYGPVVICAEQSDWQALDNKAKAVKISRQGVPYHVLEGLDIMQADSMMPVAKSGEEMGEVMFKGNVVMKGYLLDEEATKQAFAGGWFHSGDLGVMHQDNYIELKDRSKDIIISGGENISSIEVENCLYAHPNIVEAAVVAKQDDKWGETPCAFVGLALGKSLSEQQVIDYCQDNLAHFKIPKHVVFGALPKTATGKVKKFKLREIAKDL